ncbi:TlyA family RNA methyltransferase [Fontisphaera persica]|uniref:TlyA family RNA methyltransferase n=1 Tax=Fontisphaera persica TaxID=2974023 RepID=UPI0024BF88B2|nr:TlyA family RNA methyltransferase [Fontisphaera persica]WCJ58048.1 TlyA family RNA methyltransferase [Fontisphaera persica]
MAEKGKSRLDVALVARGLAPSREKAQRLILAGQVRVAGQVAAKPSQPVRETDPVEVAAPEKYVSRGGLKLEHALRHFGVDVTGRTAVDLGASTGGFTDCLLQHGAARVYAVDVGTGQLAWKLRQDPRVVVRERTNARYLQPADLEPNFAGAGVVVIDCSFISLQKILPAAVRLAREGGLILALVKPQFEAGKTEADRGEGVIRDPAIHERVLRELEAFVPTLGNLRWRGMTESPILGPAGNKEFWVWLEKQSAQNPTRGTAGQPG